MRNFSSRYLRKWDEKVEVPGNGMKKILLKVTSFPLCYLCHRGPGSFHLSSAGVYFCTFTQKSTVREGIVKSPAPGPWVERVAFEVLVEILVGGLAEHGVQVLSLLQHAKWV